VSRLRICGVLRERPSRLPAGPSGGTLRLVECGALVVAVEAEPGELALNAQALADHDATIRSLAAQVEAILPARFGWIASDEASLRSSLEPHGQRLLEALELTAGREQMTLRVYGPEARPPEAAPVPALGEKPGTRYLAARRDEARRRREVREIAPLRPALSALVRAERVVRHLPAPPRLSSAPSPVASVYHLVDRGRSSDYRAIVAGMAARLAPVRTTVTGPWPPYAYAPEGLA